MNQDPQFAGQNAPPPAEELNPYSINSLITALDSRLTEEKRITELNRMNIDNLEKILGALRAIA